MTWKDKVVGVQVRERDVLELHYLVSKILSNHCGVVLGPCFEAIFRTDRSAFGTGIWLTWIIMIARCALASQRWPKYKLITIDLADLVFALYDLGGGVSCRSFAIMVRREICRAIRFVEPEDGAAVHR